MDRWWANPNDVLLIFKIWEKTTKNVGLEMIVQDATLHREVTRKWNTLDSIESEENEEESEGETEMEEPRVKKAQTTETEMW